MVLSGRLIKRRIKSIANTKKITKAMELVAAAKMRKAVSAVLASKPYATLSQSVLREIAKKVNPSLHPLLSQRQSIRKVLLVIITSDRGLCGGFNSQILKLVDRVVSNWQQKGVEKIDFVTIGKKGQDYIKRRKWNLVATFTNLAIVPSYSEISPVARLIMDGYQNGLYDIVEVIYTDFTSPLKQEVREHVILPLNFDLEGELGNVQFHLGEIEKQNQENLVAMTNEPKFYEFLFEPSPKQVLDFIVPRILEVQIYQAILESAASEHSARMLAMRNATDAAEEMINDLTFTFNQFRQMSITREMSEISAGKAALE